MPIGLRYLKVIKQALKIMQLKKPSEVITLKGFYVPRAFVIAAEETSIIKGVFIKWVWDEAKSRSSKIIFEECYSKDFLLNYLYFEVKELSLKETPNDEEYFQIKVYGKKINPVCRANRNSAYNHYGMG